MATLEERLQNLTQDINPSSGRMSDEEVRRIRQNDPMAARFGSADTGFYTDQPKDFTNEEKVYNTLVELQRNAQTPEESEKLLQMISQRNKTLLSGVPDPMMSGVDTNPMQPLVEMGFGEQVDIILGNPADSDISRQAQQQIINEMGTGMDIDSFLMEVNNLAPKGAMSNIDAEVMQRLMSAGRDGDTAIGHLTEGEVVIPAPVLEALTAGIGKASGLSTKDALLGGALSYGGSKLFGGTPAAGSAGKASTGNIFSRVGEYIMPGKDGIGLLGNLGKSASGAYEYVMPGKDNVGLFGNVKSGIGSLFGGGQQLPEIEALPDGSYSVDGKIMGYSEMIDAGLMDRSGNLVRSPLANLSNNDGNFLSSLMGPSQGSVLDYDPATGSGQSRLGLIEDFIKGGSKKATESIFGGGDDTSSGGMGMMGKLGIAGLAGLIGKLAYEEAKNQKGVPLTPLTQMDQLGRYNIEAEIARRTGAEAPSRVEFGLNPEGMPALSGGSPRNAAYGGIMNLNMGGMPRYNYGGGVQYFNQGGAVAMAEGGDMDATINIENFPAKDGQIDGPGTEVSDDIPAMLSDGEFVMTAKAVKGAGSFNINDNNGILTLTPNGDPSRDSGTRVMYKLMEHFGKVA
jgi:hypothetical protein